MASLASCIEELFPTETLWNEKLQDNHTEASFLQVPEK